MPLRYAFFNLGPLIRLALPVVLVCFLTGPAPAEPGLSEKQLKRFSGVRAVLQPLDGKEEDEALAELTAVRPVEGHLRLQEIIAGTYQELTKEFEVNTASGRRQLYGRIQMNMAFLQMGGLRLNQLPPPGLDRDIAVRLKKKISAELAADERLFYTLED